MLKELNLSIKSNSLNALVGDSGCGKSTLFNLLLRFEREYLGKILVGKYSIEEYSKDEYAKIMTCVSQQPYLFHMSIYDNLALINSDMNKIREACKQAEIDDYIMSLPMKYDTVLEEAAINISGGQKQRIAIARALLKNSKILLCDEVTSALDEKTASGLFQTLKKLKDEHTIILISHKPHEYNQCENIIYLFIILKLKNAKWFSPKEAAALKIQATASKAVENLSVESQVLFFAVILQI